MSIATASLAESAQAPSECPSRDAVATALRGLLSQSRIEVANLETAFELRDLGQRYIVTVRGRIREYDDEMRNCERRARTAAVFVALTIAPPDIHSTGLDEAPETQVTPHEGPVAPGASSAPTTSAPTPVEPTPTVPEAIDLPAQRTAASADAAPDRLRFGAELGVVVTAAPRKHDPLGTLGAEMRFVLTRSTWGIVVGASLTTDDEIQLGTSKVREARTPIDVGIRFNLSQALVSSAFDIGPSCALLRLQQVNAPNSPHTTLWEVGARAGLLLGIGHSTFRPYLRGFAELYPVTRRLAVEPRGSIGETSMVWVGAAVGLAGFFN